MIDRSRFDLALATVAMAGALRLRRGGARPGRNGAPLMGRRRAYGALPHGDLGAEDPADPRARRAPGEARVSRPTYELDEPTESLTSIRPFCKNCHRFESEHVWRCVVCDAELTSEPCGCGRSHLPARLCHPGGAFLRCPTFEEAQERKDRA